MRAVVGDLENTVKELHTKIASLQEKIDEKPDTAALLQLRELSDEMNVFREEIANTSTMTDAELIVWIDKMVDESKMFQNPHLSLKDISKEIGVTQKRIAHVLRTQTKFDSLNAYLTEKRLLLACKLLVEHQNWVVDAISKEAGFSSRRTFQDVFKSRMGVTPSQYRLRKS